MQKNKKPPKKKRQKKKLQQPAVSAAAPDSLSALPRVPRPIRPLVDRSEWPWLPPNPVILPDLPIDYPAALKVSTERLLLKAESRFPKTLQLGQFCLCFIDDLTPHVKSAVEQGVLRGHEAMDTVLDFVCFLIIRNCGPLRTTAREFIGKVRKSDSWRKLVDIIKEAENTANRKPEVLPLAHSSAPVYSDPKTEERPETADELSYDKATQVLKFGERSFTEVNQTQFNVIKCLYDADTKSKAGISRTDLMTAFGKHPNTRLGNLFQRKARSLKEFFIAHDRSGKLYRFKPPRNKPRPNQSRQHMPC